ncbi:hypothetical protein BGW37DRAFT_485899 [Umbelopsis sp. PMI_123]|nr:hypothetical protein BGW37DRAFT_485899 [Umbelopsis sp. PMI_123]
MSKSRSNGGSSPPSPIFYSNDSPRFIRSMSDAVTQRRRDATSPTSETSGFRPAPQLSRPLFDKRSQTWIESPTEVAMDNFRESTGADYVYAAGDENNRYSIPPPRIPNEVHNQGPLERSTSLMASKDPVLSNDPPSSYTPGEDDIAEDDRHTDNQSERNSTDNALDQSQPTEAEENQLSEQSKEELLKQLEQYELMLTHLQADLEQETIRNKELNNDLAQTRKQLQRREQEYARIEHNFFEHTKIIRATDDDLSTIRDTFKLLKYAITRFVMSLNKKADREKATEKFHTLWPHLPLLELGTPLEHGHINMLTEKLIHQHLVNLIFKAPLYPGLHINGAYSEMSRWLQDHGSEFSTRLRQQLTAIIAKSKPETDIQMEAQSARSHILEIVYNDLADIYDPVMRDTDSTAQDGNGTYYGKIREIIDKSLKLSIAIRGQDVDITILPVKEGEQMFDDDTMVEFKGKTEGKIKICICPPFFGGDGEHGFIEKGKVVC